MEVLRYSFDAVAPLILLVLIGKLGARLGMIDDVVISKVNRFLFLIPFPVSLFRSIATLDLASVADWKLYAFALGSILTVFLVLIAVVPRLVTGNKRRGALIQGIYRGNFLLLGYPLARNLFGSEGVGPTAMLMPAVIVTFNILAVFLLESFRGEDARVSPLRVVFGCLRNPLIIGAAIGVIWSLLRLPMPTVLSRTVSDVSSIANPMALILLGGQFNWGKTVVNRKLIIGAVLSRMVLIPLVVISAAVAIGFRGPELGALFLLFCGPTAVSSYIMARNMDSDVDLAGQIVLATTLAAGFCLFAGIVILRGFGWI